MTSHSLQDPRDLHISQLPVNARELKPFVMSIWYARGFLASPREARVELGVVFQ